MTQSRTGPTDTAPAVTDDTRTATVTEAADGTAGAWSNPLAHAWEARRDAVFERHRRVSEWLVEQIAPGPGQVVLELAAGTGETGFLAAELIGPTGKLLSTDITPAMVEAAQRGAADRALSNVECRVIDAQDIDLPDDSVDAVLCRFALMLTPEPERALREIRRVLRAGGRLAYAVFGSFNGNPWITLLADAIRRCGHQIPDDPFLPDGRFFSLAAPDKNRHLLTAAGFTHVTIEEIDAPRSYQDFDEYWDHHTHATGPITQVVQNLSREQTRQIQQVLRPMISSFRKHNEYLVPANVIVANAW